VSSRQLAIPEIAKAKDWSYAEDDEGQPGRNEDSAGMSEFGGVHSQW
jgi:hypothetical protein